MIFVVDASVAVEYLLKTPLGVGVAAMLDSGTLVAPQLLDAEVLSALRRDVLAKRLALRRAEDAMSDLQAWGVIRLSHQDLLRVAWSFRHNTTIYDGLYLAAGRILGAPVVTADGPLARSEPSGVTIHNIR